MSAVLLAGEGHDGSDSEIREWMSGNLCRCGAYHGILQTAIRSECEMGPQSGGAAR